MGWQRARQPQQKAHRRSVILEAARALFADQPYEQISLTAIARTAGMSKANVYRYFATREEIFLAIFDGEFANWAGDLIERLEASSSQNPADISKAWVQSALQHRTFLELLPQLSSSMEKNASVQQVVHFKLHTHRLYTGLLAAHAARYPKLNERQWHDVLRTAFAMLAGLWPFTNPPANVIEALNHPEVHQPAWEFEPLMTSGLTALIKGKTI